MPIQLPPEVAAFLDFLGLTWPDVNENHVAEFAQHVREFARSVQGTHTDASGVITGLNSTFEGHTYRALVAKWAHISSTHMTELDEVCHLVANALDAAAVVITGIKYAAIAHLTALAASYIAAMAATVVSGGIPAATMLVLRTVVRRVIDEVEGAILAYILMEVVERAIVPMEEAVDRILNGWGYDVLADVLGVTELRMDPKEIENAAEKLDKFADTMIDHARRFDTNVSRLTFTTTGPLDTPAQLGPGWSGNPTPSQSYSDRPPGVPAPRPEQIIAPGLGPVPSDVSPSGTAFDSRVFPSAPAAESGPPAVPNPGIPAGPPGDGGNGARPPATFPDTGHTPSPVSAGGGTPWPGHESNGGPGGRDSGVGDQTRTADGPDRSLSDRGAGAQPGAERSTERGDSGGAGMPWAPASAGGPTAASDDKTVWQQQKGAPPVDALGGRPADAPTHLGMASGADTTLGDTGRPPSPESAPTGGPAAVAPEATPAGQAGTPVPPWSASTPQSAGGQPAATPRAMARPRNRPSASRPPVPSAAGTPWSEVERTEPRSLEPAAPPVVVEPAAPPVVVAPDTGRRSPAPDAEGSVPTPRTEERPDTATAPGGRRDRPPPADA